MESNIRLTPNVKRIFDEEGSIELSYNRDYKTFKGIFSFVLYWHSSGDLRQTTYYRGIQMYVDFIHNTDNQELKEFFKDVGIIIYTDEAASAVLKGIWGLYKNVVIAVMKWPRYTTTAPGELQKISSNLFRLARFQAIDAFPNAWICVRDADTLFPTEINWTVGIVAKMNRENKVDIDDYRSEYGYQTLNLQIQLPAGVTRENIGQIVADKIGKSEMEFINKWLNQTDPSKSMFFGINEHMYRSSWHRNIPFVLERPTKDPFPYTGRLGMTRHSYTGNENAPITGVDQRSRNFRIMYSFAFLNGVFAGFANFKVGRPRELWIKAVDYVTSRNPGIIQFEREHRAGDPYKAAEAEFWKTKVADEYRVGDDERLLIFGIAANFPNQVLFGNIIYYDYKLPSQLLDMNQQRDKGFPNDPVNYWFKFDENDLVNTIDDMFIKYKYTYESRFNEANGRPVHTPIPIYSRLLHPNYISSVMASITPELQANMQEALQEYNTWIRSIMSMSNNNLEPYFRRFEQLTTPVGLMGLSHAPLHLKRSKTLLGGRRTRRRAQRRSKFSMKRRRGRG
jgi:hypothetical protein